MKKILLTLVALIASIGAATASSGIDWSSYKWLDNGSGDTSWTEKFKIENVSGVSVVNIQTPGGKLGGPGIYCTFPSVVSSCNLSSYGVQGAGICLHCSAFTAQETQVTVTCSDNATYTFWVYYADGTAEGETVAVTGVSLPKTATVGVGDTTTLTATFTPKNATNKNVTWTTSNESIATVADGVVTGVAAGKATITVKTEDGNYTATCTVTVSTRPTAYTDTWDTSSDTNVASGCDVYVSAIHSGEKSYITDNTIGGACQLAVTTAQPTEWVVIDLAYSYDISKISFVTTGDRKDKEFEIYYAPAQSAEPSFADGKDALDGSWTLAFYAEDDYSNTGVGYNTYSVSLSDVRYIKYVGTERNATDIYGTGVVEVYVAGTSNDVAATTATAINATAPVVWTGETATVDYSVENSRGTALTVDASKLSASSSNADVATVTVDSSTGAITITGVAEGTATITISYDTLTTTIEVTVHSEAPTPDEDATNVLSLYSDTYTTGVSSFAWADWGGCTISEYTFANGHKCEHVSSFKYLGSQFPNGTDVSGYDYFHVDIYSTVATTIGIVPITHTSTDYTTNTAERGVTTDELKAFEWNSFDIAMSTFTDNGVTNLELLYQIKYNKSISGADQLNCDGTPELYIDNVYFYKGTDTSLEGISVDNSADVEYYNLQGMRVANPENGIYIRRQGNSVSKVLVK